MSIAMIVSTAIVAVITTILVIKFVANYHQRVGEANQLYDDNINLHDRLLASEKECGQVKAELEFLKASIVQLLNRAVLATLSDQQVNQITGALIEYINTIKSPEKMN